MDPKEFDLIVKELSSITIMCDLLSKKATRLKKKIEGGVSTSPNRSRPALDPEHLKFIGANRKKAIQNKIKK